MIIKIRTDKIEEPKREHYLHWVFLDGFRKVKSIPMTIKGLNKIDVQYYAQNPDLKDDDIGFLVICTRRDNDEDYAIITTETTYLLNDEGKTIEKLNS